MDPSEMTPSDGMPVMLGVVVTSLAIAVTSLWVFCRRRARSGRSCTQEGKGQKDKVSDEQPEQSEDTPIEDADANAEQEEEEEGEEEEEEAEDEKEMCCS